MVGVGLWVEGVGVLGVGLLGRGTGWESPLRHGLKEERVGVLDVGLW